MDKQLVHVLKSRKLEARDKVVYWVVLDYLNRAKSVDAGVTNTVNSQLATYKRLLHLPRTSSLL